MANLVAINIKRKDVEVASHGFSMFLELEPKRIKLQDEVEILEMMEEEELLADADAGAAPVVVQVKPTMLMPHSPSPLQPAQGQEAAVLLHESTMSTESGSRSSSEPPLAAEQAAPMAMDIEEDSWQSQPPPPPPQPQPGQHPRFFSGFF